MDRKEKALKNRAEKKYNCAQSVLCAFDDLTGPDTETALAIGDGFGGGLHCGQVCGALSGGVMALGIICKNGGEYPVHNEKIRRLTKTLTKRFKEEEGHYGCWDLLASTKERRCEKYILDTIGMVEEILEEEK